MSERPVPPRLATALARAGLPAYLFPAASASFGAVQTGDDHLATAALTTIAGSSLLVTLAVTAVAHRRGDRRLAASGAAFARRATAAALVLAGLVCAVLVGNDLAATSLVTEVLPSAGLGAAIAATLATRGARRRVAGRRRAHGSDFPCPGPAELEVAR